MALQEAQLYASGQSMVGPSPSTSLKRDRLMHRNAILRRTGFLEGTNIKGSIAGALFYPAHRPQLRCGSAAALLVSISQYLWHAHGNDEASALGRSKAAFLGKCHISIHGAAGGPHVPPKQRPVASLSVLCHATNCEIC